MPSPAPFYNFAVTPEVNSRDPFWAVKQAKSAAAKPKYKDIVMPKNTSVSIFIAGFALLFGFGAIWHIWWLSAVSLLGVITSIIVRVSQDETEYIVPAAEIKKIEAEMAAREQYA